MLVDFVYVTEKNWASYTKQPRITHYQVVNEKQFKYDPTYEDKPWNIIMQYLLLQKFHIQNMKRSDVFVFIYNCFKYIIK